MYRKKYLLHIIIYILLSPLKKAHTHKSRVTIYTKINFKTLLMNTFITKTEKIIIQD